MKELVFFRFRAGVISIKNFRNLSLEAGENIPEEELLQMIARADLNQDGLVSEEEFYEFLTRKD